MMAKDGKDAVQNHIAAVEKNVFRFSTVSVVLFPIALVSLVFLNGQYSSG